MQSYRQPLFLLAILLAFLFAASVVFGERGYGGSRTVLINKFGTCARVTNRNSLDLLIPTGTAGEWSNFRSYAPNVSVGGVNSAWFILGYASYGPSGAVTIQCGDSGTIGLKYQPNTFNTCSYAFYTGPTFDSSPSYARSDGGCYPLPPPPDGRVPDFVYGTPAAYSWQIHSGNGCNGCAYQNVSYDGVNTITFYSGQLTPYGNVTVTWDAAGNTIVNIPPEPPPPPPEPEPTPESFIENTKVLTILNEWTPIQDIAVGDFIIGRNGKANKVIGLYRHLLGDGLLYEINGEVVSTKDHLFMTSTGKWGALDPKYYADVRFNQSAEITVENGQKVPYVTSRILPKDVAKIEEGSLLELFDGTSKQVSKISLISGHDAKTVLYTLATDGNESYTVEGGYVVDGMPQR